MHAMDLLPGIEIDQSVSYNSSLYSTVQNLDCGQIHVYAMNHDQ